MEQFRKADDYIVVRTNDDIEFEKQVQEFIKKDYVPAGAPLIALTVAATQEGAAEFVFLQAMVKYASAVVKV